MGGKIEPLGLGNWDTHAALHSALEALEPGDQVLILAVKTLPSGDIQRSFRSANMTKGETLFELERKKIDIFLDFED